MSLAKLVSISKPIIEGVDTAEELVAYCARVSNPSNQANKKTASKLVRYLIDNEHWSPLEMVHVVIEIETTRDIARQILRHRSFSFQEFSQRYAEVVDFAEPREARLQDDKNRQNSIEIDRNNVDDCEFEATWYKNQQDVMSLAECVYAEALDAGIAKEVARSVLPEGLTQSRLYMAGTLRSWIHYCQLRMANGTQKEHMDIAKACWEIICREFPGIASIFDKSPLDLLIEQFGAALQKKLEASEEKYEWNEGWMNPHWEDSLRSELRRHLDKGDPLDVAAYCAFAHYHGWKI